MLGRAVFQDLQFAIYGRSPSPVWRPDLGELQVNGVCVRKVKTERAWRVTSVLDKFESSGWPKSVKTDLQGETLSQTVYELNTELEQIRFRVQAGHIIWEFTGA